VASNLAEQTSKSQANEIVNIISPGIAFDGFLRSVSILFPLCFDKVTYTVIAVLVELSH